MHKVATKRATVGPLRYWEISELLREDITSGKYAIGARLPTEEQLIEQFGSSRHCIREALRVLTEDGLVLRKPRAGSTVIAFAPTSHFTQRLASVHELLNYPTQTLRRTLSATFVKADNELAVLLKCPLGASWFRIEALRIVPGSLVPLCKTDIYIAPEFAKVTGHKKHELIPVADQIAEMFGKIADSTNIEIAASLLPASAAELLQVPANSAALNVIRRYADSDGKVYEVTVSMHPSQRYTYNFHLKRERSPDRKRASPN